MASKKKTEQDAPTTKTIFNRNSYKVEIFIGGQVIPVLPMSTAEVPADFVCNIKGIVE